MRSRRPFRFSAVSPLLVAVLVTGCYRGMAPNEDADPDADPEDDPVALECDRSQVPRDLPLRRLTKVQYENTVRDLLRWALPDEGDAVAELVAPQVAAVPDDTRQAPVGLHHGGFTRMDQAVHQEHIDATYAVGRAVGAALTQDAARLSTIAGSCAVDDDASNDTTCVDDFILRFGERALRRPLDPEETTLYRAVYDADGLTEGADPEAFADVITAMMASPYFLYLIEHGDEPVEGQPGAHALDGYELASRLSYHLWQSPPDDALREAAANGELLTPDGYRAQVDRLFDDPRTRASLAEFHRQWLWLDDLPAMDALVGNPRFDAFLGEFSPGPQTHEHMADEVLAMLEYYTFDVDGTLDDVMSSDLSFARDQDVAQLYGVAPWTEGEPPVVPDGERFGLLTRAALTASGTANTRPIMKGVFIRTALLCQPIPPPPDNANAMPPAPDANSSTREVVEQLTEQDGSGCASCHANLINPLGFATENFDALGRVRSEQILFDDEGRETARRPIDTSSVPQIVVGDDTPSQGVVDVAQQILDSGQLQTCFARQYLRFTHGREEDSEYDACAIEDLASRLDASAPLSEVVRAVALRPEFKQRFIDQD
ncbi:MAG: DUF1592 domain-containing protein [Deltaproteobacteria bacterium]|nr:DUF1592 domain-containing protein [Deltaproteobacteria bacterium]